MVRQQQDLFFGQRVFAADYRGRTDFVRIAEGFGVTAYDLEEGDPFEVLARAFAEPGPCLVRAPIRAEEKVYPMVPPGAANREMIGGERHVEVCC
jgi:acetolactate synthase-1/2/3 large subunit